MNTRSKLVTLVAAGLAAFAAASNLASIEGYLYPRQYEDHLFDVGEGDYVVRLGNYNPGDLDAKVFASSGEMLGKDTLPDNWPVVHFYSDRDQTIKVRVFNASRTRSADYVGTIEVDDEP